MSAVLKTPISRISISLPEPLLRQLDAMVCGRGFDSRSQAIADMINQQLAEHRRELGENVMAGTITLIYNHATPGLQKQLTDIQHRHLSEVISSLHVHLMDAHTMEVMLVQGPARQLQVIADALLTCRGVITGKLHLSAALLPPVHPLPAATTLQKEENTR